MTATFEAEPGSAKAVTEIADGRRGSLAPDAVATDDGAVAVDLGAEAVVCAAFDAAEVCAAGSDGVTADAHPETNNAPTSSKHARRYDGTRDDGTLNPTTTSWALGQGATRDPACWFVRTQADLRRRAWSDEPTAVRVRR